MNKLELFNYLNNVNDKSGNLKKEGGFRKHFPEMYNEYSKTVFIDDIKDLPFKQKLWHFLKDIYYIPKCKICNGTVNFVSRKGLWGYCKYCSGSCAMKDEDIKTKLYLSKEKKYGDGKYNNSDKLKETIKNKNEYFWKNRNEKSLKTRLKKNNGKYFSDESIQKIKNTNIEKYGVDSFAKTIDFCEIIKQRHDEIQQKQYLTKSKNKSFNTSNIENNFDTYLSEINIPHIRQYKSDLYPYSCDFYIPNIDLYIEIQGTWTHGKHPFNINSDEDNNKLELWKNKNSKYYNQAIYTWTELDVKKREIAKSNHINYIEIFSNNIDECISIFENYIKELLSIWCYNNNLPGNSKWSSNHPIWDCNVDNKLSPRNAWKNIVFIKKAIDNIFYMIHKDNDFCKKHINEILKCTIENNKITNSTEKLLQLVQNRFTIAKIAPKVTAISAKTVKDIIYESNIDISNGVYVPMSGFGGIIEGVKEWCTENNIDDIDIEAYDINDNFCKWYGWKHRDILSERIITNKTCICCPPFGKKYEHWKGTPREMSDKTFIEWYKLIKEYVIAPNYIIIGPEVSKNENKSGLFAKKNGVMLWNDDMICYF